MPLAPPRPNVSSPSSPYVQSALPFAEQQPAAPSTRMHHLHPRSRSTSTLFTTTLAISFLVVGAPHLLPCPVDRRQFADSFETPDGKRYRRRRPDTSRTNEATVEVDEPIASLGEDNKPKRECPVPKPGGIVGQIMGFNNEEKPNHPEVVVEPLNIPQTQRVAEEHRKQP